VHTDFVTSSIISKFHYYFVYNMWFDLRVHISLDKRIFQLNPTLWKKKKSDDEASSP